MRPELEAARRSRVVIAAAIVASLAVAAAAIVSIAVLLGWIERPARPAAAPAPAPAARPEATAKVPAAPGEVVLIPGETLVAAPDAPVRPAPLMPPYAAPAAPPPAPRETPRLIEKPLPAPPQAPESRLPPTYAEPRPFEPPPRRADFPRERPRTPRYAERHHPTSPYSRWPEPDVCDDCGVVTSVRVYPDLSEVRVRFDDGDIRVIRYPTPAPWRAGDRVRLEDGRLLRD